MDPELYEAAASGDLNFLNKPNLDVFQVTKHQKNSVLHIAVKFKQLEFCKKILNSSFSSSSLDLLTKSNSKGETALHVAAKVGCLEIAELLVNSNGAGDVENGRELVLLRMVNQENDTALHVAVRYGNFAVTKYLIELADQALFDSINDANVSLLCLAIEGRFSRTACLILEKFPNSPDGEINLKAALHSAVLYFQHDIVKLLLEKIPNSRNETDQLGWTPLHYAALVGDLKSTRLLLQGNSSPAYIVDQDGMSALHVAASYDHIDVVELLVQHCPDIHEVTDKKGRTFLHVAVILGNEKMVRHILGMPRLLGIINEKDNEGNTALHLAVINRRDSIITILARNREIKRTMKNNNLLNASDIFRLQERKIGFWLWGTHGLPCFQEFVSTDLRREMIGKDTNSLVHMVKEDKTDTSTEAGDETKKKIRIEMHLLTAMLIATVTFQPTLTVPGGYKDEGPGKGTAQFAQMAAFNAFVIFNTIAFVFSIATVFIQLITCQLSYHSRSRYANLAESMLLTAIVGMIFAYAFGLYVEVATSIGLRLVPHLVVASFFLVFFAIWFVDPLGSKIPGVEHSRKYCRDLLFYYGII